MCRVSLGTQSAPLDAKFDHMIKSTAAARKVLVDQMIKFPMFQTRIKLVGPIKKNGCLLTLPIPEG